MNTNIRFFIVLFSLISFQGFSQQTKPFKVRHQGYVNGDMVLIANNIVNKEDADNSANNPYNDRTYKNKLNDESMMKYIDIDDDKTTFSSSSADLVMDAKESKKIVYAGLYWSATYSYESGKMTKSGKYKAINNKRGDFDHVKIKLPNQEGYTDIKGELIYDGIDDADYKESAPYVMFADITDMVTNSKNPFGTYTIANVKSTTGMISGGISGGWSIFFVYEDPKMTAKQITTYDGFAGITEKSLDINFSGFQTLTEGKVNAKIACVALEGDLKLRGDQVLFKTSENEDFTILSNSLRDKTNFFNSSITNDNEFFQNRVPNSLNTLGYDSCVMTINNPNNSVISNNAHDATVRLKTYGDRYFMFFNAFDVEVVPPEGMKKEEIPDIVASNDCKDPEINVLENEIPKKTKNKKELKSQVVIANNEDKPVQSKAKKSEPKINKEKTTILKSDNDTVNTNVVYKNNKSPNQIIENKEIKIQSEIKGYYIVANVFAKHSNATRFIASLKKKGINAKYFINPVNNYRYVYIIKEENLEVASNLHNSKINGQYNGDLWIMTVNKQQDSALVFEEN